ncbi:MAG: translation elongation factor EF-Tu-like GTPase [Paraglaciecola sp.]|jgi:translation elongation factor EF-Tu-like GTPase
MSNHLKSKINKHVNVGTIGHIDHGISNIAKSVQTGIITTGDYIDPTPWTPEDHERFKTAMDRVRELENLEIKREIQKSISAGAGVIYVDEKVEK